MSVPSSSSKGATENNKKEDPSSDKKGGAGAKTDAKREKKRLKDRARNQKRKDKSKADGSPLDAEEDKDSDEVKDNDKKGADKPPGPNVSMPSVTPPLPLSPPSTATIPVAAPAVNLLASVPNVGLTAPLVVPATEAQASAPSVKTGDERGSTNVESAPLRPAAFPGFVQKTEPSSVAAPEPGEQKARGPLASPSPSESFWGDSPWVYYEAEMPKISYTRFPRWNAHYLVPDDNRGINLGYPCKPLSYLLLKHRELDIRSIDIYHKFGVPLIVQLPTPGDFVDIYSATKDRFNMAYPLIAGDADQSLAHYLREFRASEVRRLPRVPVNILSSVGTPNPPAAMGAPVPIYAPIPWARTVEAGLALMDEMFTTTAEAEADARASFNTVATYLPQFDEAVMDNEVLREKRYRVFLPWHPIPPQPAPPAAAVPRPRLYSYELFARDNESLRAQSLQAASIEVSASGLSKRELDVIEARYRQLMPKISIGNAGSAVSFVKLLARGLAGGAYCRFRVRLNIAAADIPLTCAAGALLNRIPLGMFEDGGHHVLSCLCLGVQVSPPTNIVTVMTTPALRNAWVAGDRTRAAIAAFLNVVLNPARYALFAIPFDRLSRGSLMLPAGYLNAVDVPGSHLDAGEITRIATQNIALPFLNSLVGPNSLSTILQVRLDRPNAEFIRPNIGYCAGIVYCAQQMAYVYRHNCTLPMAAGLPIRDVIDITGEEAFSEITIGIGDVLRTSDNGTGLILADTLPVRPPPDFKDQIDTFPKWFLKADRLIALINVLWRDFPYLQNEKREFKDLVARIYMDKVCAMDSSLLERHIEELMIMRDQPGDPLRGRLPAVDEAFIRRRLGFFASNGESLYRYVSSDCVYFDSRNITLHEPVGQAFREALPPRYSLPVSEPTLRRHNAPTDLRWLHTKCTGAVGAGNNVIPSPPLIPLKLVTTVFWSVDVLPDERTDGSQPEKIDILAATPPTAGVVKPPVVDGPFPSAYALTRSAWKNRYKYEALEAVFTVQPIEQRRTERLLHIAAPSRPMARIYPSFQVILGAPTSVFRVGRRNTLFSALVPEDVFLVLYAITYVIPEYVPAVLMSVNRAGGTGQ